MVNEQSTSGWSSRMSFTDMGDKELLEFYQNKFSELQKKDDTYRLKVDKHLQDLIADRYELEAEVCRRGEKISDLQKSLVDLQLSLFQERERFLTVSAENERLKKNEELLHKSIQDLLKHTKDKNLIDRIIYILHDSKAEIAYRKGEGGSSISLPNKKSSDYFLEKQIQELQSKIDEYNKVSKSNSDVILEDCKTTLEKSREKIQEDEQEIRKLQRKLQETESELRILKNSYSELQQDAGNRQPPSYCSNYMRQDNRNVDFASRTEAASYVRSRNSSESPSLVQNNDNQDINSHMKNIKFALVSLSQISVKLLSLLKNIFSSRIFVQTANLSNVEINREFVEETDITQLQNYIRQCTRLCYDLNNIWKSVRDYNTLFSIELSVTERDMNQLQDIINDLALSSAETDILSSRLSKATFFDYLTKPTRSHEKFGRKESGHSKYAGEMVKLEEHVKVMGELISKATMVVERIIKKIDDSKIRSSSRQSQVSVKSVDSQTRAKVPPGRSSVNEDIDSHLNTRRTRSDPIGGDDVTRKINKTLAKIKQIETGEFIKDHEFCNHLGKEIANLSEKLKSLYNEFNAKSLQDQFSQYSSVTLGKLETLAKQSRDTVLAAEAQITTYRKKSEHLLQKLQDTEELLRENINECLGLKQKLRQQELQPETNKAKFKDHLQEKFDKYPLSDECETAVKTVGTSGRSSKSSYPFVMPFGQDKNAKKRPVDLFECMYCKQGPDHKACDEKIKDLSANLRKLTTQLKIVNQELKEEKKNSKLNQEQAERLTHDSNNLKEEIKETIQTLESKKASLTEQLKISRNRLKTMERYRRSEIEGFQTDIRRLKQNIVELQKQLNRAVLICENDQRNLELLSTVHGTAQRSKATTAEIRRLKAKIYEIETDIKHL